MPSSEKNLELILVFEGTQQNGYSKRLVFI